MQAPNKASGIGEECMCRDESKELTVDLVHRPREHKKVVMFQIPLGYLPNSFSELDKQGIYGVPCLMVSMRMW